MMYPTEFNYFDIMGMAKKNYSKLLEPICRNWSLTKNELDVMLFLYNNPQYDRATDVVNHRGMAKSHVSLSVSTLEEKKLLTRRFDDKDRRAVHLALTQEGHQIAGEARDAQMQYFSSLYAGITEEEFALWGKITRRVCDNIENLNKTLTKV